MSDLQPPYRAIWRLLGAGQIIPFLGAGASLSGRGDTRWAAEQPECLPTAGELGKYLADEAGFPEEDTSDLAKVAQYFRAVMGRPYLRQWLRTIFNHSFPYASVHALLADIPTPLLIVTTNYDELLEQAFRDKGRPFDLVIHQTDDPEWSNTLTFWQAGATEPEFIAPKNLLVDLSRTTVIYKMHGGIDRVAAERDSFVIDEDDYADFLVRVAAKTAVPAAFAEAITTRSFLFLGYSLRDWNFRMILSKIDRGLSHARRARDDRVESWAIQKDASALERKLWDTRNVTIFDMDIELFVQQLRQARGGPAPGEVR